MRVSAQHANPYEGNESTLLRFSTADDRRACVLVDAGDGVDVESLLGDEEYLTAILLTHAHIDHYLTLARNRTHEAPIYAAPATAAVLERALPEADKDNDVGPVGDALDALEPIDDWTAIIPEVDVRPVPAGHAPGAAGFVCRIADETDSLATDHHLLCTGDFTRRPCAGFDGLPATYPFEIDSLILNVATNDDYESTLRTAVETLLERAFGGSRVVVAGSALAGAHVGRLLATVGAELDRPLPITLVGQTAKVADALDIDHPSLDMQPVFDDPSAVLEPGRIAIAGPADPTSGGAERLVERVADEPGDCVVQLADGDGLDDVRGSTHSFDLANHPASETIEATVEALSPLQVILKHGRSSTLKRYQRSLDHCFVWGGTDRDVHPLFADGEWLEPDWISEEAARTIKRKRWERLVEHPPATSAAVPAVESGSVDLADEGLDVDALRDRFDGTISNPYTAVDRQRSDSGPPPGRDDESAPTGRAAAGADAADGNSVADRSDTESFETAVLARLAAIEAALDDSETVPARVLGGGDERLLKPLADVSLDPGEIVSVTIDRSGPADGDADDELE